MKRLFLVRHAKSGQRYGADADILRTLNERGLKEASLMAGVFASHFKSPGIWFSSPAVRAMETAKFFAKASTRPFDDITIAPALYSFEPAQVIRLIESCSDNFSSAIYFFHNPTMTEMIQHYTGEWPDVPTCAVVVIDFDTDSWQHLSGSTGTLKHFDYPEKHV